MGKQCLDSAQNGCSLLSGAGMVAGGAGSLVGGGTAVGLCNPKKKHEKMALNPINRENIRSSFRFLIAQKLTRWQAFW